VRRFLVFDCGVCIDKIPCLIIISGCAGVVKLVDAEDSKSSGPRARAGSIPASGTTIGEGFSDFAGTFFCGEIGECNCFCNHLRFKVGCLSLCWKK
jgi:hypothetical protein